VIFTILAVIISFVLIEADWPIFWAIAAGIGISFLITTVGGYLIMFLMAAYATLAGRRVKRRDAQ
jgi:biotin transporter BioY